MIVSMLGKYVISEHGCRSWYEHSVHRQEDGQAKSARKKPAASGSSDLDFEFFCYLFLVAPTILEKVRPKMTVN